MDQPKIERMLRLMKMMAGNRNYTIDELAEKLGTSYRSIYRYIDTFKDCGFVVNKVRSNVYKLGKLPKSCVDLRSLIYFSEEEAYVVNSLIDSLDATNMLKSNLKNKLSAVYESTNIVKYVQKTEVADRFIEPFEFTTNCIDVWGFDLKKQENRVFKISRIGKVCLHEDGWSQEENHQTSKTDFFRISNFEQTPVKLELSLMAKNLLVEEYPLAERDLRYKDDRWILETMVSGMEGFGRFVMGLAGDIKIMTPLNSRSM